MGGSAVVKLNDRFACTPEQDDIGGVLMSLYSALTADELAQVSVNIQDAKLQLVAPPAIVLKIGYALGLAAGT